MALKTKEKKKNPSGYLPDDDETTTSQIEEKRGAPREKQITHLKKPPCFIREP